VEGPEGHPRVRARSSAIVTLHAFPLKAILGQSQISTMLDIPNKIGNGNILNHVGIIVYIVRHTMEGD
jgi:hypothetical protein